MSADPNKITYPDDMRIRIRCVGAPVCECGMGEINTMGAFSLTPVNDSEGKFSHLAFRFENGSNLFSEGASITCDHIQIRAENENEVLGIPYLRREFGEWRTQPDRHNRHCATRRKQEGSG